MITAGTPPLIQIAHLIGGLSGLMHVNSRGARRDSYQLPGHDTVSEPIFVPRRNDSAEGDGWLLSVIWRAAENRSDLAVFEASELNAGPIALVQLGHRVPDGFHGTWVPTVRDGLASPEYRPFTSISLQSPFSSQSPRLLPPRLSYSVESRALDWAQLPPPAQQTSARRSDTPNCD